MTVIQDTGNANGHRVHRSGHNALLSHPSPYTQGPGGKCFERFLCEFYSRQTCQPQIAPYGPGTTAGCLHYHIKEAETMSIVQSGVPMCDMLNGQSRESARDVLADLRERAMKGFATFH